MSFTNLSSVLMLSGNQNNNGQPLGIGFPYLKFAWEVEISGEGLGSSTPLVAKTCELPRWSTDTQIVNVYNHKTIVQTKFNFEPITITLYDQCNNLADGVIWNFVKGQFDPSDGSKAPKFEPLEIKITQKNLSGDGGVDKTYTLKNAYITDAQHDTLDYSSSDVVLWTITVRYEDLDTQYFSGQTPVSSTGIKPSAKPPAPVVHNPAPVVHTPTHTPTTTTQPPDATNDKPADPWKQNGGGEVTRSDKPDPTAAVTGIPRGRLGLHKLPGDVGYTPPSTSSPSRPSWWSKVSNFFGGSTSNAMPNINNINNQSTIAGKLAPVSFVEPKTVPFQTTTDGTTTTIAVSLTDNTAKEQTYDSNTGTNQSATKALDFNSAVVSQQTDYVSRQITAANLNTTLNPAWRDAYITYLTAHPPVDNSLQAQKLANDNAKKAATTIATMYAPRAVVDDIGVIINKQTMLSNEPTGPAVVNGFVTPNANDPRSISLSNAQATREQKYKLENPLKDLNGY